MLEKFEFGDLYRFCVSLGLAMILAALFLPVLLVKDEGLVQLPSTEQAHANGLKAPKVQLSDLERAQLDRQRYVRIAFSATPVAMGTLGGVGLLFFLYGLINWRTRQLGRDSEENAKIAEVLKTLAPSTQGELKFKREIEDADALSESVSTPASSISKSPITSESAGYAVTEDLVVSALQRGLHQDYEVYRDRKLGSEVIDGLLLPRVEGEMDVLLEVKLLKRGAKAGWLFEVIAKTSLMVDLYHQSFGRKARGVVVVVTTSAAIDRFIHSVLTEEFQSKIPQMYPNVDVRIFDAALLNEQTSLGRSFVEARSGVHVTRAVA